MRRIAAVLTLFVLGCQHLSPKSARSAPPPPPPRAPLQEPADPRAYGPYAYNPDWKVPQAQYVVVSEVEFGASHKLSTCTREFANFLVKRPDTRIFPGTVTARNEYGDAFHAHLVAGERDELVVPGKDGVLKAEAKEGTLVLVTSPLTVESAGGTALVPAHTLSLRICGEDPSILAAQPFVTVVRPKDEGDDIFVAAAPHNEGEAIFGIYEPSKRHVGTAQWAHGEAILAPRFVVEVDGWQKVGTYPFPPDLPPDAAGTQFVSLELKENAEPVRIALPGRPVIAAPTKPVSTRADVFVSFYGMPEVKTAYVSGHGFAKEATPEVTVELEDVSRGVKNLATTIELPGDGEEGRTVFYIHRVAAEWKEKGGRAGFLRGEQEKPAASVKPKGAKRSRIRSNASAFLRQIRFMGTGGVKAGASAAPGGVTVVPGSLAGDAARWLGGQVPTSVVPAGAGASDSGGPQAVTNVYINVTHDAPYGGLLPGAAASPLPVDPYQILANDMSGWRPGVSPLLATGAMAPELQAQGYVRDPNLRYTRDPVTGQVYSQLTPYGAAQQQQVGTEAEGGETLDVPYDPTRNAFIFTPFNFTKKKKQGW